MNQRTLISKVRDVVNEIVYDGNRAVTFDDLWVYGDSRLHDIQIAANIESAARFVAARVSAKDLGQQFVQVFDPAAGLPDGTIRVVDDRTTVDGVKARRISYRALDHLAKTRKPTAEYPAYMFEDCDLTVSPVGTVNQSAAVVVPITQEIAGVPALIGTVTNVIIAVPEEALGGIVRIPNGMTDPFNPAGFVDLHSHIVGWTPASITLEHAPDQGAPALDYTIPAVSYMNDRLEAPIIKRAAELCLTAIMRPDTSTRVLEALMKSVKPIGIQFAG